MWALKQEFPNNLFSLALTSQIYVSKLLLFRVELKIGEPHKNNDL